MPCTSGFATLTEPATIDPHTVTARAWDAVSLPTMLVAFVALSAPPARTVTLPV